MRKTNTNSINYRLGKNILQSTPISNTYNIQNTISQQIWKCKAFDLTLIQQYDMLNVLQYNEQVLKFLADKYSNSLHFQKTFQKNQKQFLVVQFWNERLSDYILKHPQGITNQDQVKNILQDVIMSICDIYAQNYMVLNLRPQQIVKIQQPQEGSLGWRIQSLVFQYNTYGLPQKCQYQFDYDWASNQQKAKKQNLQEECKDQQIVWYIGILALRLIYGPNFKIKQKFKDSDINLDQIKKLCRPDVYQLIQKSVKANLKDRISLKNFLNLSIFSKIEISNQVKDKFITGNNDRIRQSSIMKGSILQKSINRKNSDMYKLTVSSRLYLSTTNNRQKVEKLPNKSKSIKQKPLISETQAEKIFNYLKWILQKILFLAEIKDYTQTAASIQQVSIQDKTLIRYLYFKISQINLIRFQQIIHTHQKYFSFRESQTSKDKYKQLIRLIQANKNSKEQSIYQEAIAYQNKMKKLNPKKLQIFSNFQYIASNLKKSIQSKKIIIETLIQYFPLINGKYFTALKRNLQDTIQTVQNKGIKKRALCYLILAQYSLFVKPKCPDQNDQLKQLIQTDFLIYKQKFQYKQKPQSQRRVTFIDQIQQIKLRQYTKQADQAILIQNCRCLLTKYFKTAQNIQNKNISLQNNQNRKRLSLQIQNKKHA